LGPEETWPAAEFVFPWEQAGCSECGQPLHVLATRRREVVSVVYGKFVAIERQGYCPHHADLPPARSVKLQQIVAPSCNLAYDVLAHVGWARFVQCRPCEEIQEELSRHHGIMVPVRTVNELGRKFVAYFQVVHQESIPLLRRDMGRRGGYILHVDGTCEGASPVLLVCLDSLSGQVLESRKIGSENHEEVLQVLNDVRRDWGVPLATVHDLRRSLITAARDAFPGTPQFVCHYHLVADVGKDLLSGHVDRLRGLFRRTKVRPKLRALRRSLKEILDIVATGGPRGGPAAEFETIVAETRRDREIFERLRRALRICPPGGTKRRNDDGEANRLSPARHLAVLKSFRRWLERKACRGDSQHACQQVLDHLDKYWDLLFGHVLRKLSKPIVVPRTNNPEESLFRKVKRQCRRLHGRGHVGRDLEEMPEAAPLVLNLNNASYCKTVYGGAAPEKIAERFSIVDPQLPARLLKDWHQAKLFVRLPRKFERRSRLPRQLARFLQTAYKKLQE